MIILMKIDCGQSSVDYIYLPYFLPEGFRLSQLGLYIKTSSRLIDNDLWLELLEVSSPTDIFGIV